MTYGRPSKAELSRRADRLKPEARRLEKDFARGDTLAPLECCARFAEEELGWETLPTWVVKHLATSAAAYYNAGPHDTTPRDLLLMSSKERRKIRPSLERIMGLGGVQGRKDAWSWRAEHARDQYLDAYLKALIQRATHGDNLMESESGNKIRILDKLGRLRSAARNEAAKSFRLGGFGGKNWDKSKSVRRRAR
jgi:hypothetical protein